MRIQLAPKKGKSEISIKIDYFWMQTINKQQTVQWRRYYLLISVASTIQYVGTSERSLEIRPDTRTPGDNWRSFLVLQNA